jgi:hypothetical protein
MPSQTYRHFLSCFQAVTSLHRLRAGELPGPDPAYEVDASVEVLQRRGAHHREPALQFCLILKEPASFCRKEGLAIENGSVTGLLSSCNIPNAVSKSMPSNWAMCFALFLEAKHTRLSPAT